MHISKRSGQLRPYHHCCSVYLPTPNYRKNSGMKEGEMCGGRHPAYKCPRWAEAIRFAAKFQNFHLQWRIDVGDRGHADDVARYKQWAESTTRALTDTETQTLSESWGQVQWLGETRRTEDQGRPQPLESTGSAASTSSDPQLAP